MSNSDPDITLPGSLHRDLLFAQGAQRTWFEEKLLPSYIPRCRWFGSKARDPRRFSVRDLVPIDSAPDAARLALIEVDYADESTETWLLPLQWIDSRMAGELATAHPQAILAQFADGALCDALHEPAFRDALFSLIIRDGTQTGEGGAITAQSGPALRGISGIPASRALALEQSNSSLAYGDSVFLKLYRRLEPGLNPDAEILRFLSRHGFPHAPPFAGSIEYRDATGHPCVLALATGLVANNGDAWSFTLRELARFFETLLADDPTNAAKIEAESLSRVVQLGMRTGELHLALAADSTDVDFAPEPFTNTDGKALTESLLSSANQVIRLVEAKLETLPTPARDLATQFASVAPALQARARNLSAPITAAKIRTHGDYHLGQVLETGGDFVIIDFEGEPLRSLATRREKRSPLRDVAGMLRSFDYAAHAALEAHASRRDALAPRAAQWSVKAQRAFLEAWLATTQGGVFRAAAPAQEERLLEAFLLEKALYEVVYEINNRPAWLQIPLRGVLRLLEDK